MTDHARVRAEVRDLKPNEKNPRKITDKKLAMLKKSLAEFGDLGGVVFNRRSGQLLGGHQRVRVLPPDAVIQIEREYQNPTRTGTVAEGSILIDDERFTYREVDWDDAREKAANIAANKGAGEWDLPELAEWMLELDHLNFDLDLTMFDAEERENLLAPVQKVEAVEGEDEVPETPEEPKARRGDIYQLGRHRLLCGDSTSVEDLDRLFQGDTAELCFTSPPYADQREYNGGKELSTQHLATFIRAAYGKANYFAVNLGYSRKDGEVNPYWDDYIKEAKDCGLKLLSWNVWDRFNAHSVGQMTAIFPIEHEWIFVFGEVMKDLNCIVPNKHAGELNHGTRRNPDGSLEKKTNLNAFRTHRPIGTIYRGDVQRFTKAEEHKHPAMFPVAFPEAYIEAMTSRNDIVFEPFGGSGTTLIAAEKLGRTCLINELDPRYCDVIVSRFEKFTGQKAELVTQNSEETAKGEP